MVDSKIRYIEKNHLVKRGRYTKISRFCVVSFWSRPKPTEDKITSALTWAKVASPELGYWQAQAQSRKKREDLFAQIGLSSSVRLSTTYLRNGVLLFDRYQQNVNKHHPWTSFQQVGVRATARSVADEMLSKGKTQYIDCKVAGSGDQNQAW